MDVRAKAYILSLRDIYDELKFQIQSVDAFLFMRMDQAAYIQHLVTELKDSFVDMDSRPVDHAVMCLVKEGLNSQVAARISHDLLNLLIDDISFHFPNMSCRDLGTCDFYQQDFQSLLVIINPTINR